MLKDKISGHVVISYKSYFMLRLALLLLVIVTAVSLALSLTDLPKSASGDSKNAVEIKDVSEMKQTLLKWMTANSDMPEQLLSAIYDEAATHSNTELILAICAVESNFNPNVRSRKGAIGLMGVLPSVWLEELKGREIVKDKRDLYLISANLKSGAYVLHKYLKQHNNLELALRAYVGGDIAYVGKVLQALGEIYLAKMLSPAIRNQADAVSDSAGTAHPNEALRQEAAAHPEGHALRPLFKAQ